MSTFTGAACPHLLESSSHTSVLGEGKCGLPRECSQGMSPWLEVGRPVGSAVARELPRCQPHPSSAPGACVSAAALCPLDAARRATRSKRDAQEAPVRQRPSPGRSGLKPRAGPWGSHRHLPESFQEHPSSAQHGTSTPVRIWPVRWLGMCFNLFLSPVHTCPTRHVG